MRSENRCYCLFHIIISNTSYRLNRQSVATMQYTYWEFFSRLQDDDGFKKSAYKWLQFATLLQHTRLNAYKQTQVLGRCRSTNLQLPICQNGFQSIRCNPTLSISISKWSSETVYLYIAVVTTAVCHEPNARFMFRRNKPFPI